MAFVLSIPLIIHVFIMQTISRWIQLVKLVDLIDRLYIIVQPFSHHVEQLLHCVACRSNLLKALLPHDIKLLKDGP